MPHEHSHIDGECYPSVTTVAGLKKQAFFEEWRKDPANAAKAKASTDFGTAFHAAVERLLRGEDIHIEDPQLYGAVESFENWFNQQAIHPLMQEVKVWSKKYRYQGTFDCVARDKDGIVLFDWKTSKQISSDMGLQLNPYIYALHEMTGIFVPRAKIVQVSKEPPYLVTPKEFEVSKSVFKKFLKLRKEYGERPCDGSAISRNICTGAPIQRDACPPVL